MCAFRENDVTTDEPSNGSRIAGAQDGSATSILNETSINNGGRLSLAATIPGVEFRSDLPLSFAQEPLWFWAQMEGCPSRKSHPAFCRMTDARAFTST